jgi:hypothetical protein
MAIFVVMSMSDPVTSLYSSSESSSSEYTAIRRPSRG